MKNHLSPRDLAEATGVSESSIKRWIADGRLVAARTAGGHRRIELAEALRFVHQSDLPLARPGALGLAEAEHEPATVEALDDPTTALHEALETGQADQARGIVLSCYMRSMSVAQICDGPLAASMSRIGMLYHDTEEGIFIEHRATVIAIRLLHELAALLPTPPTGAPLALGSAAPGDPYQLPTLAAATTLDAAGWRTINLGPDLPIDSLYRAALKQQPRLVWLSVSSVTAPKALERQIADLAADLGELDIALILGGREAGRLHPGSLGQAHPASTMAELAAFARALRR